MIDIHSHIIFGIDDGSRTFDESKDMVRLAIKNGTKKMVATSHYIPETYNYTQDEYIAKLNQLRQWIQSEKLDFEVFEGNELYLSRQGVQDLLTQKCMTINKSKYILVEAPSFMQLQKVEELLDLIMHNGFIPVIAHIERLRWVLEDIDIIKQWFEKGYIFQINAESLITKRYKENFKSAHRLLKKGLVHLVASDGHRINHRTPIMEDAFACVDSICGNEMAVQLFEINPQKIIGNKIIEASEKEFRYSIIKKMFYNKN